MDGEPAAGFRPEEALSRKEALEAMTIRTAEAQFEEALRGDLSQRKLAEFTILDTDIREAPEDSVRKARVLGTVVDGEFVYQRT
jgi:predicted amidohydrolase YtcJ